MPHGRGPTIEITQKYPENSNVSLGAHVNPSITSAKHNPLF